MKDPSYLIESWIPHHSSSGGKERNAKGSESISILSLPIQKVDLGEHCRGSYPEVTVSVGPNHQNKYKSGLLEASSLTGNGGHSRRHPSCLLLDMDIEAILVAIRGTPLEQFLV